MSGSSRKAARSEAAKLLVWVPTSRWLISDLTGACTNSIGSSIVKMCAFSLWLISSTIAASVVDLPEPVGPVTSTMPRGSRAIVLKISGVLRSASEMTLLGITRKDDAGPARLPKHIDAKARDSLYLVRKILVPALVEALPDEIARNRAREAFGVVERERRALDNLHIAVQAHHRRQAGRNVEVRGLVFDRESEKIVNVEFRHFVSLGAKDAC